MHLCGLVCKYPRSSGRAATATLGATFARIGREADAAGFYSLWVMDHFFQIRGLGPPKTRCWRATARSATSPA